MAGKDYATISGEISTLVTRLAGVEAQAASIRSDIVKLVAERAAIEQELRIGAGIGRNSKGPSRQTQASRAASAELRDFWRTNADRIGVEFKSSGPIPTAVRQAFAKK